MILTGPSPAPGLHDVSAQAGEGERPSAAPVHRSGDPAVETVGVRVDPQHAHPGVEVGVQVHQPRHHQHVLAVHRHCAGRGVCSQQPAADIKLSASLLGWSAQISQ